MKTGGWFEEVNQLGDQLETFFANKVFEGSQVSFKGDLSIPRFEHDLAVVARSDLAISAKRGGEIYRGGARMKQIKGPNVDGAAGKINARRC